MGKFCSQCGTPLQEGWAACPQCGKLTVEKETPPAPVSQPTVAPAPAVAPVAAPAPAPTPKKSKAPLVILIVVLVLAVLGAAGAAVYFLFFAPSDTPAAQEEVVVETVVAKWRGKIKFCDVKNLIYDGDFNNIETDITLEFKEDGTYVATIDIEGFKNAMKPRTDEYIQAYIKKAGISITVEQFRTQYGITDDQILQMMFGGIAERTQGVYADQDGSLVLDDEKTYTYTIKDNTLTLSSDTGMLTLAYVKS